MKSIKNLSLATTIMELVTFIFTIISLVFICGLFSVLFSGIAELATGKTSTIFATGIISFIILFAVSIFSSIIPILLNIIFVFWGFKTNKSYGTPTFIKNAKTDNVMKIVTSAFYLIKCLESLVFFLSFFTGEISLTAILLYGVFFLFILLYYSTFIILTIFYTIKLNNLTKANNNLNNPTYNM